MAIREIIKYPAQILHKVAAPVAAVNDEIRDILDDMAETMYAVDGVGLAAPQIGVSLRLAVIDINQPVPGRPEGASTLIRLVNPEIVAREGEIEWEEACLSVPEFFQMMKRSRQLTLKYLDENGDPQTLEAEGLLAVAVQQELDHLDGRLIIDTASTVKQDLYLSKAKKKS